MSFFHFKYFTIRQSNAALKVGTDAMLLGAFIRSQGKSTAVDIGTGTGVLSLMVAQENPEIKITAIEINEDSCLDAAFNFSQSSFSQQFTLINRDFLTEVFPIKFDLIFSNPPFYEEGLTTQNSSKNLAKHVAELTPIALCKKVAELLENAGQFWAIWPFKNRESFLNATRSVGLHVLEEIVLEGKPSQPVRSIFCCSNVRTETTLHKRFCIRNEDNTYTEEYVNLTRQFHNKNIVK